MEGAFLVVEGRHQFGEALAAMGAGEAGKFLSIAFIDHAGGLGESGFKAVGIKDDAIAGVELDLAQGELFIGKDAEEGAVDVDLAGFTVGVEMDGEGMTGAGDGELEGLGIENAVDHGDELTHG